MFLFLVKPLLAHGLQEIPEFAFTGSTKRLSCPVKLIGERYYSWYKGNNENQVQIGYLYTNRNSGFIQHKFKDRYSIMSRTASLNIRNISQEDEDYYACKRYSNDKQDIIRLYVNGK